MRLSRKFGLLIFLLTVFLYACGSARAEATPFIEVAEDITQDTTWTKAESPYVLRKNISVLPGAMLTIESGAVIKIDGSTRFFAGLSVYGILNALGTVQEPIYFTSFYDDEVEGNIDDETFCDIDEEGNDIESTCESFDLGDPLAGDWYGLYFDNSSSVLQNVVIKYTKEAFDIYKSDLKITNLSVADSNLGIVAYESSSVEILGGNFNNLDDEAITIFNGSSLTADNLKIENVSSFFNDAIVLFNDSDLVLKNSLFRDCPDGGCVTFFDGRSYIANPSSVDIENTIFEGGVGSALLTFSDTDITANVRNSSFSGFDFFAVENYDDYTIGAKNNWWGDPSGPYHEILNPEGLGEAILGNVSFEPWCENEDCRTRNPVLIIPGVLGTEIFNGAEQLWLNLVDNFTDIGDEFMDVLAFNNDLTPVNIGLVLGEIVRKKTLDIVGIEFTPLDYSEGLINEFISQGYTEGTDLFTFPYDWRYGINNTNVENLKQKIADILAQTGKDKVDVVAHSTGGLLVKKYVTENPDAHKIDKAIFVGVPNTGAPKAIKALVAGDSFGNPFLSQNEMKKLARNLPVVYDLAPSFEYYQNKGSFVRVIDEHLSGSDTHDLTFNETINFLKNDHNLNEQAITNSYNLHTSAFDNFDLGDSGVDLYNIVGCKAGTIGKIIERRVDTLLGGTAIGYLQPEMVPGDGTVPLESATNLPIDEDNRYFALKASHGTMLTQDGIRQQIVNILSDSELGTNGLTQNIEECKLNGRAIAVYSPISIDVIDQDGNHLGLSSDGVSIENNIPNANFEIIGEEKFVYLPDDDGQTYEINLLGAGVGTFTITDTQIENNQETEVQSFMDIPVTTQTQGEIIFNDGQATELRLDVTGDGVDDFNITPSDSFDPVLYLQIVKTTINSLDLPEAKKKAFSNKIDNILKKIEEGKINRAELKAERFKIKMEKILARPDPKKPKPRRISKTDAQLLLDMLNGLLDNLN